MKQYHITDLFKSSWPELSTKEHGLVLTHLALRAQEKDHTDRVGFHNIMILRALRKNNAIVSKINIEQVVDCINDLNFLAQPWYDFPRLSKPHPGTRNPEPYLKHHTFGQLFWMDSLFSKYMLQTYWDSQAHPPTDTSGIALSFLHEMIGVIYTDPESFDERKVSDIGKAIGKVLTDAECTVILHTYINLKTFIIKECPNLFPQPDEDEAAEPETRNPEPVDSEPMWQSLLFDLSETAAYPGMEKAKRAPMYEALNYLEKKVKEVTKTKKTEPENAEA